MQQLWHQNRHLSHWIHWTILLLKMFIGGSARPHLMQASTATSRLSSGSMLSASLLTSASSTLIASLSLDATAGLRYLQQRRWRRPFVVDFVRTSCQGIFCCFFVIAWGWLCRSSVLRCVLWPATQQWCDSTSPLLAGHEQVVDGKRQTTLCFAVPFTVNIPTLGFSSICP